MNNSADSEQEPCGVPHATCFPCSSFPGSDIKNESISDLKELCASILKRNGILEDIINEYDQLKPVLNIIHELSFPKRKGSFLEILKLARSEKAYIKSKEMFYMLQEKFDNYSCDNESNKIQEDMYILYLESYDIFYNYNQLLECIVTDYETWRKGFIDAPKFKEFTDTVKGRVIDRPSQILSLIRDVIALRNLQAEREVRECEKAQQSLPIINNFRCMLSVDEVKILEEHGKSKINETILRLDREKNGNCYTPFESACVKWKEMRAAEIKYNNRAKRQPPDKPDRGWW